MTIDRADRIAGQVADQGDRSDRIVGRPQLPPWIDGRWFADRGLAPAGGAPLWRRDFLHEALVQSLTETVLPALLRYEDRNSMAFSIESRVPFLTPRLARLRNSRSWCAQPACCVLWT